MEGLSLLSSQVVLARLRLTALATTVYQVAIATTAAAAAGVGHVRALSRHGPSQNDSAPLATT